jgi:L-threonylcarbamoyladenylate synthase
MTVVLPVDARSPDPATIGRAAACLRSGGLVAFPTETVYGLGVHALDRGAVARLFEAKGRPTTDPLIVHVATTVQAQALSARFSAIAEALAARFWPGPLTLVLPKASVVPDEVTAGLASVALRVPSHPVALALLVAAGVPIAAPSANLFSRPSPTRAAHVLADLDGRIDLVLDGGATTVGVESTVVDLTTDVPRLLRPGGVSREALVAVLGSTLLADGGPDKDGAQLSPGLLERHYSPRTPLTAYEGEAWRVRERMRADALAAQAAGRQVGLLIVDEDAELAEVRGVVLARSLGAATDLDAAATHLYAALRDLDASGADVILAHGFDDVRGLGAALRDRLRRAAAGRIVSC